MLKKKIPIFKPKPIIDDHLSSQIAMLNCLTSAKELKIYRNRSVDHFLFFTEINAGSDEQNKRKK